MYRFTSDMRVLSCFRYAATLAILLVAQVLPPSGARGAEQVPTAPQLSHRVEKVSDGVYFVMKVAGFDSNSVVVINDRDVLVVDSGTNPSSALSLVADIKKLTDKPIHFVVNTHYHFDHTQGNQVFGSDVLIIGSEFTRNQLASNVLQKRTYVSFVASLPQRFESLKQQAAAETDPQKKNDAATTIGRAGSLAGGPERRSCDTEQRDGARQTDAVPGESRNPNPILGTRPYRRRFGRLSPEGEGRVYR